MKVYRVISPIYDAKKFKKDDPDKKVLGIGEYVCFEDEKRAKENVKKGLIVEIEPILFAEPTKKVSKPAPKK